MKYKKYQYLLIIFFIGFTSLIYEIYSTKVLFLFFVESTYAVTIAISAFLAGLAFSSLFFSKFIKTSKTNTLTILWCMQIAAALYGFFVLSHYDFIPKIIDILLQSTVHENIIYMAKIAIFWIYLFIPAFFIGGAFPILNTLYAQDKEHNPAATGIVYFWDTIGSVIGAMLAGFVLLPYFGLVLTVTFASVINIFLAFIVGTKTKLRFICVILLLLIFLCSNFSLKQFKKETSTAKSIDATYPELEKYFGDILFQENSPFGKVTVGNNAYGKKNDKGLFINYRSMCLTKDVNGGSEIGTLSVSQLPQDSRILNIGLGCGLTAKAIADQPQVATLDIAEINPVVVKASDYFKEENGNILKSSKTTLHIQDGYEFVRNTQNTFDAIVVDVEEPTIIDSSPLYTQEFFMAAKKRLKQNGIFSLWAQSGKREYAKALYNTLHSVFRNVSIRIFDNYFTFYATDSPAYHFSPATKDEQSNIDQILQSSVSDINTIDNRILGKYFDVNQFFGLPSNYTDPFEKNEAGRTQGSP